MPAAERMSTFLKFLILIQAPRKYKALIKNLTSNRGTVGMPSQGSYKHRRRLWGQPGHAPLIIKMGANPIFCPPIIRQEFNVFLLFNVKT